MTPVLLWTRLRFYLRRQGWPAWLGIALLLFIWPVVHWGTDLPRQQAQSLREQAQRQKPTKLVGADQSQTALRMLRTQSRLADPVAALGAIDHLHRSAAARGLSLSSGEYRLLPAAAALPQRYQIQLPVDGSYPQIRAWIADAMNAQPGLALEELSFSRETVADPELRARVRWTLYLKAN